MIVPIPLPINCRRGIDFGLIRVRKYANLLIGDDLMPHVKLVLFRESDGSIPLLQWLQSIPPKSRAKCLAWLERLRNSGHELRRPIADYVRDGIYELRVGQRGMNYRILYFFHGREAVVVSHGLVKERIVPPKDIDLAVRRRNLFMADPAGHSFEEA
jgi:phage-related protein